MKLRLSESGPPGDLEVLVDTRLLVQANSGGGKSWCIRRLLEQTHGHVQHLVIDPEGEFASLREKYDYVLAARHAGDTGVDPRAARLLAERLLELGVSAILDIYELKAHERIRFVRQFLEALVDAPKRLWHPALVIVDEAHVFCPQKGDAESAGAVIDLATRGRKRGFCAVLATQRLSKLHKDAAAECNNKLIGRTGLDVDVQRAADELGLAKARWTELRDLAPGEFFAFGPALSREVLKMKVGKVQTTHPKAGSRLAAIAPAPTAKILALVPKLADLPAEVEQKAKTEAELRQEVTALKRELRKAGEREAAPMIQIERVEVPVITDAVAEKLATGYHALGDRVQAACRDLIQKIETTYSPSAVLAPVVATIQKQHAPGPTARVTGSAGVPRSPKTPAASSFSTSFERAKPEVRPGNGRDAGDRPVAQRRVLSALAWLQGIGIRPAEKTQVALFAKLTPDAGHTRATFGALRTAGLIDYPSDGTAVLTDAGAGEADPGRVPQSPEELHAQVLADLPKAQREVLRLLIKEYPKPVAKAEVAELVGLTPDAGHTRATFGRLRTLRLIGYPTQGSVVATSMLFPEGGE